MTRSRRPLPAPDFLRPERPAPFASWLWLATAVAVLLTATLDALAQHRARADAAVALQARLGQLERVRPDRRLLRDAKATVSAPSQAPARPTADRPATAPPADTEAWAWQQRLQHPWPSVLMASEQAAEAGLSWLSWQHDVQGRLQLEGLADDPHTVLAALARLQARPAAARADGAPAAPLRDLLLTRMEAVDGGWRFTLQARSATEGPRS
jgi:hypothetical protein